MHTPPVDDDVLLVLDDVGKRFDIYPNDRSRLLELVGERSYHAEHWAVRNVSLSVRRGQALGVIGSNGAGKSTLLRMIAGVTEPTEGAIEVSGRLATLLDLGLGFHDTFSGRENIRLTCALLGMSDAEIDARIPDILRFAELGEFIDHPVRTYSTGMNLRLGFAIAVHAEAEVLVVDEVLVVGDQYFQRKCLRRIEQALEAGTSLVLVTHDLHGVRALCSDVLWMDAGRPRLIGPAREVVEQYVDQDRARVGPPARTLTVVEPRGRDEHAIPLPVRASVAPTPPPPPTDAPLADAILRAFGRDEAAALFDAPVGPPPSAGDADAPIVAGTGEARIVRVRLLGADGAERARFRTGESLVVAVTFRTTEPLEDPIFGAAVFRNDGVYVYGPNTRFDNVLSGVWHGVYTYWLHVPTLRLLAGTYRVSVAIYDRGHVAPHVWHNQLYGFEVAQDVEDHGLVQLEHTWGMVAHLTPAPPERA